MKAQQWQQDEFVDYDEYAYFGVGFDYRERNWNHCMKNNIPESEICPLCSRQLKEGSYRMVGVTTDRNYCTRYYLNPPEGMERIKVGEGCIKRLVQAYKKKYGK